MREVSLPDSWEIKTLSEVCGSSRDSVVDGPFGSNLKRSDFVESGRPILKIQNVKPNQIVLKNMDFVSEEKFVSLARHTFCDNDIVMTKLGDPLGVAAIVHGLGSGVIVADLVRIRPAGINTSFLCYQLNSPSVSQSINDSQKGTTRPRVNLSMVRQILLAIPPPNEQAEIVRILEEQFFCLDAAAASIAVVRRKADQFRRSLLHTAFAGGLTQGVASRTPEVQVPAGWSRHTLSDIADITMGQSPPGSAYNDDGVGLPFFQGKAEFGSVHPSVKKWTTEGNKKAYPGDILMSVRAPVGPTNIADTECVIGRGLAAIRAREQINQTFLLWFLKGVEGDIASKGTGTTFDSISGSSLRKQLVNVPPLPEQDEIVRILEKQFSCQTAILAVADEVEHKLGALRRSLLQAAFSGELTEEWRKKNNG